MHDDQVEGTAVTVRALVGQKFPRLHCMEVRRLDSVAVYRTWVALRDDHGGMVSRLATKDR